MKKCPRCGKNDKIRRPGHGWAHCGHGQCRWAGDVEDLIDDLVVEKPLSFM